MTAADLLSRLESRPKEKTAYELPTIEAWEQYKIDRIRYDRTLLLDWVDGFLACPYEPPTDWIEALGVIVAELRKNP
jgi:hypothetical protein